MDRKNYGIINLSDSDDISTTSSCNEGSFEVEPITMDIHEITKYNTISKDDNTNYRSKKQKKKKKFSKVAIKTSQLSDSSSSLSEYEPLPATISEISKEEFYDAHESYHGFPEKDMSNPIAEPIAKANSVEDAKISKDNPESSKCSSENLRKATSVV